MSRSDSDEVIDSSPEPVQQERTKRKRPDVASEDELEIDVNLPEPPSKKAKRLELKKEKRDKKKASKATKDGDKAGSDTKTETPSSAPDAVTPAKRTDYGIWIGNLPWSATKDSLRLFLREQGSIDDQDIVRIHMPPPALDKNDTRKIKPQNKGFAYVDFTTKHILDSALELSEQLLGGRRVLIKNAKSFEGRPDKPKPNSATATSSAGGHSKSAKPPARRIFVGNLDFAITQDDLYEHFGQAGEVEDVHMATFEDSGKCKGFGWVRFAELEAAEAAVRGYIFKGVKGAGEDDEGDEGEGDEKAKGEDSGEKRGKSKRKEKKKQKWFINRLHGRELRCEFAEDSSTRYKKRFGKENKVQQSSAGDGGEESVEQLAQQAATARQQKRERPQRKIDARKIAPAKALANAARSSAAIVQGAGKKLTFDE